MMSRTERKCKGKGAHGRVRIRRLAIWPWALLGLLLLFGGLGSIVAWAALTEIHGAVIAPGRVIVQSRPKTIQHLDGGIVGAILVRDGDRVKVGDVLLRLDDEALRAGLAIVSGQLDALRAETARLEAERDGRAQIVFPEEMTRRQDRSPELARKMDGQRRLLEARRKARIGKKRILEQKIAALEGQIKGLEDERAAKSVQITLLAQEIATVSDLLVQGQARRPRLLSLQRERARLMGERGRIIGNMARARESIGEIRLQIHQIDADAREKVVARLREVQDKIAELAERETALKDKLRRIDIRAPVTGRVHNLAIHTVGGVVAPGKPIMQIIPESDRLIVEARIAPTDIDQVHVDQKARLHLTAFDRRTTPELDGRVVEVSADRVVDPKTGQAHFTVEIEISESELARLGPDKRLVPGMPVEAFIRTYPRTPLTMLAKPFTDAWRKFMRSG